MATNLSGSLSEFTLAEVLALLSMGRRTARMQVSSPTAVGVVQPRRRPGLVSDG